MTLKFTTVCPACKKELKGAFEVTLTGTLLEFRVDELDDDCDHHLEALVAQDEKDNQD